VSVEVQAQPTKDDLLARLAKAMAEQEGVTAALIYLELGELYTGLEASEEQAAAALGDALAALAEPKAELDRLDRAIADAEGTCVRWSHILSDADPDTRADARIRYQEWSSETVARRARRNDAERGYRELFADRADKRTRLQVVQAAKQRVLKAQLNPFGDELAQATEAYIAYRMPHLNMVLLRCDRESPEWEKAAAEFEELALRSGLRTDHLPTDAEMAARALKAGMADAATTPPDPAPSAADVRAQIGVEFGNMALEQAAARNVVDDRRGAQPQPAPVGRSYMEPPPRLKDLGVR
jgi:hypothetical protein